MFANVFTFIHRVWWLGCYKNNMKIHLFYCKSAQSYKGKKPKRKGRRVDLLGLQAFALWLCGQVQFVPIAFLAERFMYTRFSLFFSHTENRAGPSNLGNVISQILLCKQITPDFNEEELCSITKDSQDIAMLLSEMQEYMPQHEAYLGELCHELPALRSRHVAAPRCKVALWYLAKVLATASKEWNKNVCVCVCNISAISVYVFAFQSHSLSHKHTPTHTVTALLASYSLIKLHVPTLFSFFDYRTQRSPGYEWSLAGKTTPELYMQEHEPALLRLQAKLSLRAGRKCLILPLTQKHTHTLLISITSV